MRWSSACCLAFAGGSLFWHGEVLAGAALSLASLIELAGRR